MYTRKITRKNPALIVILVDCSYSMSASWGTGELTLAQGAAYAVNRTLRDLVVNACDVNGEIYDYVNLAVVRYGVGEDGTEIDWKLGNVSEPNRGFATASEWAGAFLRIEDVDLGISADSPGVGASQKLPIWIDPESEGWTPMVAAMLKASQIVSSHISHTQGEKGWNGKDCFPPIVINITDGVPQMPSSSYSNPDWIDFHKAARAITDQRTDDGNVLFFNIHLDETGAGNTILFPDTLPTHTEYAENMAKASSILPAEMARHGRKELKLPINEEARGYCLNADFESLVAFLVIGTTIVTDGDIVPLEA